MINITCETKHTLPLGELREFQGDLKSLTDKNLGRLKNRIMKSGINVPFFVWDDGTTKWILDGHQRMKAIRSLMDDGNEVSDKMPIVYIEANDVSDAREKVLSISSSYGEIDPYYLLNDFAPEIDLSDFRLSNKELNIDYNERESNGDDKIPDEDLNLTQSDTVTETGTVWELNKHKVICGDCTIQETWENLLNDGEMINLYVTDPPYNMGYGGSPTGKMNTTEHKELEIKNDNIENFPQFLTSFMTLMKEYSDRSSYYIYMGREEYYTLRNLFEEIIGHISGDIIWKKTKQGFGGSDYQKIYENLIYAAPGYEKVLYGWNKDQKHYFVDDRTMTDVWEFKNPGSFRNSFHLTMKPVSMLTFMIQNSSDYGFTVCDPFLGSGSTLIAAEKTRRVFRGMEIEPRYVDLSVVRWYLWMKENGNDINVMKDGQVFDMTQLLKRYDVDKVSTRLEL